MISVFYSKMILLHEAHADWAWKWHGRRSVASNDSHHNIVCTRMRVAFVAMHRKKNCIIWWCDAVTTASTSSDLNLFPQCRVGLLMKRCMEELLWQQRSDGFCFPLLLDARFNMEMRLDRTEIEKKLNVFDRIEVCTGCEGFNLDAWSSMGILFGAMLINYNLCSVSFFICFPA